jgi:hypothetical protein
MKHRSYGLWLEKNDSVSLCRPGAFQASPLVSPGSRSKKLSPKYQPNSSFAFTSLKLDAPGKAVSGNPQNSIVLPQSQSVFWECHLALDVDKVIFTVQQS